MKSITRQPSQTYMFRRNEYCGRIRTLFVCHRRNIYIETRVVTRPQGSFAPATAQTDILTRPEALRALRKLRQPHSGWTRISD